MNEQQGVINALRRRGNLLESGRPVPDIVEDSSPDDDDSQGSLLSSITFGLLFPSCNTYSLQF
jgi:hypothetical protein